MTGDHGGTHPRPGGAARLDLERLRADLDVHDLHVWTLTSEMEVPSAHLMGELDTHSHAVVAG